MIYTLSQGTQNYMNRQYYSLYGGVEEIPRKAPIPTIRQLLPRVAAPGLLLAVLAVLLSSHTSTSHSGQSGSNSTTRGGTHGQSIIQMARPASQGANTATGRSGPGNGATSTSSSQVSVTGGPIAPPTSTLPGLVGGYGGGPLPSSSGSGSGTTTSVGTGGTGGGVSSGGSSGGISVSAGVTLPTTSTPVLQTTVTASGSSIGATANASVPGTGKTASLSVDPSL